jgi:hypothetical protein
MRSWEVREEGALRRLLGRNMYKTPFVKMDGG